MWFTNEVYNRERHLELLREAEQRNLRELVLAAQPRTHATPLYRRWITRISQALPMRFVGRGLWKTAQESDSSVQCSVVS